MCRSGRFKDYWAARHDAKKAMNKKAMNKKAMIKETVNGREQILGRVRRALQVPAPKRHIPDPAPTTERFARALPVIRQEARAWLPPVGDTWDAQVDLFAAQCADLRAEFCLCADRTELHERLAALAADCGWERLAAHPGALTEEAAQRLALPTLMTHSGYDVAALEACDAALTQCEALVAQTGSVLITSRCAGGRTLSALTPHHVVLAGVSSLCRI